jgi:vacuolar-type H+-ATPase subunit C/Vma6
MRTSWEALATRARGLATHLLSQDQVRRLERTGSPAELADALRDTPYGPFLGPGDTGSAALEVAVTRSLAERLALLARWAGPDGRALRALYLAQDAHSLRDIVRGILGDTPRERRAAGAIPTPLLGRKDLEALSRAGSVGEAAATLTVWGHPLGSALLEEAGRAHPDPYRMEAALARRASAEVLRATNGGGRRLRDFVREEIDAGNAVAALLLVGARAEAEAAEYFIEGGTGLDVDGFAAAASAPDRPTAADRLASACAHTPLAAPLREHPSEPTAVAARVLAARIDALAQRTRLSPVSAHPVLLFVLRLRREAQLVRRALWGAALAGGSGA